MFSAIFMNVPGSMNFILVIWNFILVLFNQAYFDIIVANTQMYNSLFDLDKHQSQNAITNVQAKVTHWYASANWNFPWFSKSRLKFSFHCFWLLQWRYGTHWGIRRRRKFIWKLRLVGLKRQYKSQQGKYSISRRRCGKLLVQQRGCFKWQSHNQVKQ